MRARQKEADPELERARAKARETRTQYTVLTGRIALLSLLRLPRPPLQGRKPRYTTPSIQDHTAASRPLSLISERALRPARGGSSEIEPASNNIGSGSLGASYQIVRR